MIVVYRIHVERSAPALHIHSHDMGVFDGTPKIPLSPRASFGGTVSVPPPDDDKQFYAVSPGAMAVPDLAWSIDAGDAGANDLYYECLMGNELLWVTTNHGDFQVVNVLDALPAGTSDAPCPVDSFHTSIFRIEGREPTHLFCIDGLGDDFKATYDKMGFRGLHFQEIWRRE